MHNHSSDTIRFEMIEYFVLQDDDKFCMFSLVVIKYFFDFRFSQDLQVLGLREPEKTCLYKRSVCPSMHLCVRMSALYQLCMEFNQISYIYFWLWPACPTWVWERSPWRGSCNINFCAISIIVRSIDRVTIFFAPF